MKRISLGLKRPWVAFFILLAAWQTSAHERASGFESLLHLPLEMTGQEYRRYTAANVSMMSRLRVDSRLEAVREAGDRNLEWLEYINSFRQESDQLSFTSPETQRGIPIESPREYNQHTIAAEFETLKAQMPPEMKAVLIDGAPFTQIPPISTQDYLEWGRQLDYNYQMATRWTLYEPYLRQLAARRDRDIRGYYFLSRLNQRESKLRSYNTLSADEQRQVRDWLIQMCLNARRTFQACDREIDGLIQSRSDLNPTYRRYLSAAQSAYEEYFKIPLLARRTDVQWGSRAPDQMVVPFLNPDEQPVRQFVEQNIEEEWRFGSWQLQLQFVSGRRNVPYIEFIPGETAHVNRLGGNQLVMDANQPLTEYDAQWTIRHEFGHVLGLPDCYLEFYDSQRALIVSYQIDTTNLMCSRRGQIKEIHVQELRSHYYR